MSHRRFKQISQAVLVHERGEYIKRRLLRQVHQQQTGDKSAALAVADFSIYQRVSLRVVQKEKLLKHEKKNSRYKSGSCPCLV